MNNGYIDKVMILVYNIILLAGASYLIVVHDMSAWLYLLVALFAGTWSDRKKKETA